MERDVAFDIYKILFFGENYFLYIVDISSFGLLLPNEKQKRPVIRINSVLNTFLSSFFHNMEPQSFSYKKQVLLHKGIGMCLFLLRYVIW